MQHGYYQTLFPIKTLFPLSSKEKITLPKPKVIADVKSEDWVYHPEEVAEPTKTYARWYALVLKIEVSLCFKYITVQQAKDLMFLFPEEDEIRCLLLTTIFARILDLENFYRLVELLEPEGQMELYARLGHLNVLSPLAAERWYEFDLSKLDEREMCRILAKLAKKEKEENWQGEHHKRKKHEPWVDGWDQPDGWADDDNGGSKGRKRRKHRTRSLAPTDLPSKASSTSSTTSARKTGRCLSALSSPSTSSAVRKCYCRKKRLARSEV